MSIKKIFSLLFVVILCLIMYSYGISTIENIIVNRIIEEFKSDILIASSYQQYEQIINGDKVVYHSKEKMIKEKPSFSDDDKNYIGQKGDVLITRQSPFPSIFGVDQFISYYFGGHAALVVDNNDVIEVAGFGNGNIFDVITTNADDPNHGFTQIVSRTPNYWNNPHYRPSNDPEYKYFKGYYRSEVIGIRPNDITEAQIDEIIAYANQKVYEKALYNYLFVLDNRNKFYCTDLISRAYSSVDQKILNNRLPFNLNQDGFVTTANDLILSNDMDLFFYKEQVNGIINMYYFR